VEFNERFRIGGGFSNLSKNHSPFLDRNINDGDSVYLAKLKFNYIAYFVEYVFYNRKKWEFSVPIQLGIGSSKYQYTDKDGNEKDVDKNVIILYEPAITGQFKITRWFGVGVGAGFRIMLLNNKAIEEGFNSPIYIFKLKVFFGEIYKAVTNKQ